MQDNVVDISADPIHEVTSLSKQGSVPIGEKLVKKKVESYTKVVYNGKAVVIGSIKKDDVIFLSRIISYLVCASSKIDELSVGFIYATYKMCVEKEQVNLSEILRMQLLENLEKIKRKKYPCKAKIRHPKVRWMYKDNDRAERAVQSPG